MLKATVGIQPFVTRLVYDFSGETYLDRRGIVDLVYAEYMQTLPMRITVLRDPFLFIYFCKTVFGLVCTANLFIADISRSKTFHLYFSFAASCTISHLTIR